MADQITPTDENREQSMGRVALWLDVEDLRWLSKRCLCSPDTTAEDEQRCSRVRFRARAALHKSGQIDQ
jgi:hypothetical protein